MTNPEVSVIITSFQHGKTICRAIDSVLAQKTNFPIEVIVVDDGSTDDTVGIVFKKYYKERPLPNQVVCIHGFVHRGMVDTYHYAFSLCSGKYIAVCDGDDYWIDETKLQQQYDYMQQHPGCALCVTRVYTEINGQRKRMIPARVTNPLLTYDNLLKGNSSIYAQSFFIRKSELDKINLNSFKKFNVWDYPLVLELIQHNYFWCLDFYSAVYVKNEESVTNTRKRGRRLKYILGTYQIRLHFMLKYGCKFSTLLFLFYRLTRDIYAIVFNRWFK